MNTLELKQAKLAELKKQVKTLKEEILRMQLPDGAIFLDNGLGRSYPKEKGYYGIIVSERPAMHIYDDKIYGIDIYKSGKKVGYSSCKHGAF